MQLKNSSPVAPEKRMDLASLFCMIGRHGPAVAVAVITMVSVLAGIIIYRNVKGKRRKAAAEAGAADGDNRSPGELLQAEEPRSRVEATYVSEDLSVKGVSDETLSLNIRNRRAAPEKKLYSPPKMDSEPDDKQLRSLMQDSCNVQGSTTAEDVEDDCQDATDVTMKVAKEHHDGCLKHSGICDSHEEQVPKSDEDEKVTTEEDVLGHSMSHNLENFPCVLDRTTYSEQKTTIQTKDGHVDEEIAPEANMAPDLEEPIRHTAVDVGEENNRTDLTHPSEDGTNFLLPKKETKNEVESCIDDHMASLQRGTGLSVVKQTSLPSPEDSETVIDEMTSTHDGNKLQMEPETDLTCDQEAGVQKDMLPSSSDEMHNFQSVVFSQALLTLNQSVEPDMIDDLCDPTAHEGDPQPNHEDEDYIVPDLTKDAVLHGLFPDAPELKKNQDEKSEAAVMPPEESGEHFVSSSIRNSDAAVCEKDNCSEMPHSELLVSSQNQNADTENLELPEVVSATDMNENMKPPICQIPLCDQIELTWSSSGVENGISSMTVSSALEDVNIEGDITHENVTQLMDCCPESEEPTESPIPFFADNEAIFVKGATIPVCGSSDFDPITFSQKHKSDQMDRDKSLSNAEMFSHEDVLHGATIHSAVKDSELKKESVKTDLLESEIDKTEISIMAATMDNNEWITDSNYQVHPWMNLSVQSLLQNTETNSQATKNDSRLPADASRNADNPPSAENGPAILSCVDDCAGNAKKIVAVQPMPQNVNVTFRTHYLTHSPYQKVAITGNQQELGDWKEFIPLERAKDGHWATIVSLPVESHVEWKFVVLDKGEVCRWEECGNRLLATGCGDDLVVHKWWGSL